MSITWKPFRVMALMGLIVALFYADGPQLCQAQISLHREAQPTSTTAPKAEEATRQDFPEKYPILQFADDVVIEPANEKDKRMNMIRINLHLGPMLQGDTIDRIIKFKNAGTAPLEITGLRPG
ncbi:hypothetical protein JXQ70_16100 [bacterium]|nr:hypothetical protein [bacterium]